MMLGVLRLRLQWWFAKRLRPAVRRMLCRHWWGISNILEYPSLGMRYVQWHCPKCGDYRTEIKETG